MVDDPILWRIQHVEGRVAELDPIVRRVPVIEEKVIENSARIERIGARLERREDIEENLSRDRTSEKSAQKKFIISTAITCTAVLCTAIGLIVALVERSSNQ